MTELLAVIEAEAVAAERARITEAARGLYLPLGMSVAADMARGIRDVLAIVNPEEAEG